MINKENKIFILVIPVSDVFLPARLLWTFPMSLLKFLQTSGLGREQAPGANQELQQENRSKSL